jgi:hypothetical protein
VRITGKYGPVLVVIAIVIAVAGATPASADPSAWPYKQAGDSGVLTYDENDTFTAKAIQTDQFPDAPWWVQGFDACVWQNAINNADTSYPQYQVAGCVPVATPWIWIPALRGSGWKIYCPGSAPYNYAALPIGAIQFWFGDSSVAATFDFRENYNPGWSDHSAVNYDDHGHHWKFIIGCSPTDQGSSNTPYSNGVGPSGKPSPCCGVFSAGATASRSSLPVRLTRPRVDRLPGGYERVQEFDLPRNGRRTYTVGCRPGERLTRRRWAIGWFTARRPKRADGRADGAPVRTTRNRFAVRVITRNARRGAARLQTTIRCLT